MTQRVIFAFGISVLLACAVGAFFPEEPPTGRMEAVARAESIVLAIAEAGPSALSDPQVREQLRQVSPANPLFALLAAWSRLSIGRVGLLPDTAAQALPWLVVAALGPPALFVMVRRRWGLRLALLAVAWLLAAPGWVAATARGSEAASLAGIGLSAWAAYRSSLPRSSARPSCFAALTALTLALGVALSRAAIFVLVLMLADFAFRNRTLAARFERKNLVLLPKAMALSIAVLPLGLLVFNPALHGAPAAAIVASVLAPLESADFRVWEFALPAIALAGAASAERIAVRFLPARFVLPGELLAIAAVAASNLLT